MPRKKRPRHSHAKKIPSSRAEPPEGRRSRGTFLAEAASRKVPPLSLPSTTLRAGGARGSGRDDGASSHADAQRQRRPRRARDLLTGSLAPTDLRPRSVEAEIGIAVRRLRKGLDLTVAELGAAAGISAGMLSKIENGTISPSLSTIAALATALNVSIASLFAESDERRDCSFVKAGQGLRIERRGTKAGHRYDLLGHSLAGDIGVEPFLITLKRDAQPYTSFRHAGVELIYMLSGKVRYRHADRTYLLEPGDALLFDAAARHGPEDLLEAPMEYLSIIVYPRR